MPRLPIVAIIGRPNTGKSTLFNRMIGGRRAIVSDVPGTTRDHVAQKVEGERVDYLLLDTGGMGGGSEDRSFEHEVEAQSLLAVDAADLILFTVNGREELTRSDREVSQLLRKRRKRKVPVILAVTKCDDAKTADASRAHAHELGIGDQVLAVSAVHGLGIAELQECVEERLHKLNFKKSLKQATYNDKETPRIAVVGKPNVGKSSIVNALMSEPQRRTSPRMVSPIPGTTRDAADTVVRHDGKEFVFVDTAGLKRHAVDERGIEFYAMLRSIEAIERSDIAVLVLDGTQPVSRQDQRIASVAVDAGVGLVILLNKNDLLDPEERELRRLEISREFQFCRYAPVIPVSATTRLGLGKIFDVLAMAHRNRLRRIPTRELHRWFDDSSAGHPLGAAGSAKHLTQAEDPPPTFVLFVRNPKEVKVSQLRYLENRLRETFGFEGTPVRWITKSSSRSRHRA